MRRSWPLLLINIGTKSTGQPLLINVYVNIQTTNRRYSQQRKAAGTLSSRNKVITLWFCSKIWTNNSHPENSSFIKFGWFYINEHILLWEVTLCVWKYLNKVITLWFCSKIWNKNCLEYHQTVSDKWFYLSDDSTFSTLVPV